MFIVSDTTHPVTSVIVKVADVSVVKIIGVAKPL